MAPGDPDPRRRRAAGEPQRRIQVHRLAAHSGVDRFRGTDRQTRRAPRLPGRARAVAGYVDDDDPGLPAAESRAGAADQQAIKCVGVVRHENDDEITVLAPQVVDRVQRRRLRARAHHLGCGPQESTHLGIAAGWLANGITVDPQRSVVEERAAVHLGHVDLALDPAGERVESADQVVPVHAQVKREVVVRPGRNAHKRNAVRSRRCGHDRQRPVATGHPERVCVGRRGFTGQRVQVLAKINSARPLAGSPRGEVRRSAPRDRSASPARAALPSPGPGLMNDTGRRGGAAGRQP